MTAANENRNGSLATGCSSGPSLISAYAGPPTAYGTGLRIHLRSLAP